MKRLGLSILAIVVVVIVAGAAFFFWPAPLDPAPVAAVANISHDDLVTRGKYVAIAADCAACHTVKGGEPFAGGRAFTLPFGTIYSPNITPDADNGIGSWSDAEFVRALHHGVRKDGQNLYPAFPYVEYAKITDQDALALHAYLSTLKPSKQASRENSLSFPFDQRYAMRAWNLLFFRSGQFQPDPSQSDAWNRGAYLVDSLGHCAECHTPRNLLFALDGSKPFGGAVTQGWNAYNISSDVKTGIGGWTDEELAAYLSTGHAEGHGSASGAMAEAVDLSLRHLEPADIQAMVTYLRTVPAIASSEALAVNPAPKLVVASAADVPAPDGVAAHPLGAKLFAGSCASCHQWTGEGRQTPYAALLGAQAVNDPEGTNLLQVILSGSHVTSAAGAETMPAFAKAFTDEEVADLANYVLDHFGGKQAAITADAVAKARTATN